jgi:hypothetical protein
VKTAPLDLVLVNPGSRMRLYQALGKRLTAVENPVWAGLIATFIRQRGFSVEIVDAEADDLSPEETAARIVDRRPRLVTVVVYGHQPSASTQNMTGASAIVTAIKNGEPRDARADARWPCRSAPRADAARGIVRLRHQR